MDLKLNLCPRLGDPRLLLLIFSILVFAFRASAGEQGGTAIWTNVYSGRGTSDDFAEAIAVDGSGRVFVTGASFGTSGNDYTTIAYSQTGLALWTNRYNGPANGSDFANAIAVDRAGNVFVTGSSIGSGTGRDYATIAYSGAGLPLWTNRYNGPGNSVDAAEALVVDNRGNVFVTGASRSTNSSGSEDFATIAYSTAGLPLWTNRYDGPSNNDDRAQAVAVDSSGNVYVTGYSYATSADYDYATIKYSSAGVALWTNRYNGPVNGADFASSLAVDGSGNVFVTGGSIGDGTASDYATLAYSTEGILLWANRYNGSGNGRDSASALALDNCGNVFVTGVSYGGIISDDDYATIAYSSIGLPLWTNHYSGLLNNLDEPKALRADHHGNVFVTGRSWDVLTVYDYATIGYSGTGVPIWTNYHNGVGNDFDEPQALAVDNSGNVYVAGYSISATGNDYLTIKYSAAEILPVRLDFQVIDKRIVLSWSGCGFILQSAPEADRTFSDIPGARSPYTNLIAGTHQYFRLKAAGLSPIRLDFQVIGDRLVLSWSDPAFILQSAVTANGTFNEIIGATSPYTNVITGMQQYFRLKGN